MLYEFVGSIIKNKNSKLLVILHVHGGIFFEKKLKVFEARTVYWLLYIYVIFSLQKISFSWNVTNVYTRTLFSVSSAYFVYSFRRTLL